MIKPRFNVGDRVRVRIAKDVIPESKIVCDVGTVEKVQMQFLRTPAMQRIIYSVRLDDVYAKQKYLSAIGPLVTVGEGYNMASELQSIEAA